MTTSGNWQMATEKETRNIGIESIIVGYTKACRNLVFDVKMDFTHKVHWVKDGHTTPDIETSSCAGALTSEKHYIICGAEFVKENKDKHALIKHLCPGPTARPSPLGPTY
eukprot:2283383-Ditylum_brightwellii.AAC.1